MDVQQFHSALIVRHFGTCVEVYFIYRYTCRPNQGHWPNQSMIDQVEYSVNSKHETLASVADGEPNLNQHCANASCLLGRHFSCYDVTYSLRHLSKFCQALVRV